MDSPDAEFEWEEPTPCAEREAVEKAEGAEIRVLRPRPQEGRWPT